MMARMICFAGVVSLTFMSRKSLDEIADREGCYHHKGFVRFEQSRHVRLDVLMIRLGSMAFLRLHTYFVLNQPFAYRGSDRVCEHASQ